MRLVLRLRDAAFVDRLIRGRIWIPLIATLLLGIVAVQVSLLKLNAGIGHSVEQAALLQRRNAELRASLSQLASGDRILARAQHMGMVMPVPGSVRYVTANPARDAHRALATIRPPGTGLQASVHAPPQGAANTSAGSSAASGPSATNIARPAGVSAPAAATTGAGPANGPAPATVHRAPGASPATASPGGPSQ